MGNKHSLDSGSRSGRASLGKLFQIWPDSEICQVSLLVRTQGILAVNKATS